MTTKADARTGWQTALTAAVLKVLPLLWVGRLSWMRIALAPIFGLYTYRLVRGWQIEQPQLAYEGWMLRLVPESLREFLFTHPQAVGFAVLGLTVLSVVGLATRPALFVLAAIGLFARAVDTSQGVFDHESSLTTQVLLVLAFAPGTNAVSLEHVIRWWRAGRKDLWGYLTAPYRKWGVTLVLGLLALTYTASGLSKLRFSGFRWMDGETLGFYLRGLTAGNQVYLIGGGPTTWRDDLGLQMYTYGNYSYGNYGSAAMAGIVDWVAHTPAVLIAVSSATVLLEISGFLLFIPRLRSFMLIAYIGMHTTIGLLMGLPFWDYQIICFLLIEWELVGAWAARRLSARQAARERAPVPGAGPSASIDEADPLSSR
ncbi:hypothetical protein [Microbacterium ulmi]|uniref:HTTM domain-containing protein n=1 Tax=Microbacterium ulmi TaxID=179095 RepID=A0A7Y2Q112_9MICO|nr:hypothetical protein [Microbacterium ulmi]NII69667.1 hypothetical protein [Microbacterium ulmi]NNH03445.1 hypothetical protein [Microbacterium ulmi]